MNAYTNAAQLFNKLTNPEKNTLLSLLSMLDSRGENFTGKSKLLYHFLDEKEGLPAYEVEKHLYPSGGKSSFQRLLLRFSEKIEESLLLDTNLNREERYSELQRMNLKASKSLLKAQMFLFWGQDRQVERLCSNVIETAQEYELFSIWFQALELLSELPSYTNNQKANTKLEKQRKVLFGTIQLAHETVKMWQSIKQTNFLTETSDLQIEIEAEKYQHLLNTNYSTKADIHIRLLKGRLAHLKKEYTIAKRLFKTAVDLISEKPHILENSLLTDVRLNYAETLFVLCRFKECITECEIINALTDLPEETKIRSLEIEFKSHYFIQNYPAAQTAVLTLLATSGISSEQKFVWRLWFSQLLIVNKLYSEAAELLTELINQRYFMPKYGLCVIQMLVTATESISPKEKVVFHLSKWIRRFADSESLTEREQKINVLLSVLHSNEFNYKQTIIEQPELLNWLREPGNWSIHSNELIRFEEWLIAMRTHTTPVISVPKYCAEVSINVHPNNETQPTVN